MAQEIEIKFRVADSRALTRKLRDAGFRLVTKRTHEMNTLYDLPGDVLRNRRELLRIRKYGAEWTMTHKSGTKRGRHSSRVELETQVGDGKRFCAHWDTHQPSATRNFALSGPTAKAKWLSMKHPSAISARSKVLRAGSTRSQRNWECSPRITLRKTTRRCFSIGSARPRVTRGK
jgi:hypothetical protein